MSGFKVNFSVNNQLSTPSIHAAPFAQRPAAGQPGRVFIDSDNPSTGIYRDTGTTWVAIGNPSSPDVDTLQIVTGRGNTTTNSITVGAATTPSGTVDVRRSTAALNGTNDWAFIGVNTPTIPSGASFGVNYVNAVYGSQAQTFAGNATIGNTGLNSAGNFINTLGNSASGTITVAQGSGTIRAIAGLHAGIYYNTPNAMTFTHVAGIRTLQPINSGAVGASVTNYYGVQIADSTPSSGTISYTNRYGIYQEGASDINFFAANVGIGIAPNNNPIQSELRIHNLTGSSVLQLMRNNTSTFELKSEGGQTLMYGAANLPLTIWTNAAERMRIAANGRVLINTTTDAGNYALQVNGSIYTQYNSGRNAQIRNSGTYGYGMAINATGGPSEYAELILQQASTSMTYYSSGQVTQYNCDFLLTTYAGRETIRSAFYGGITINEGGSPDVDFRVEGDTDANLIFADASVDRVGIGTGTPAAKLHLNGTLRIDGQSSGTAGGSSGQHLIINLDGTTYKIALLNP